MLLFAVLLLCTAVAVISASATSGSLHAPRSTTGTCRLAPRGVLLGTGSLAMVPLVNSSASCCDACLAHAGCVAFGYEEDDHKCYLKDNTARGSCRRAGCVSGSVAGAPAPAPPAVLMADLTINASAPTARFSPHFLGVNADWWLDGCGGEGVSWSNNASIALVNLGSPRLKALAKGLSGATFRVGGTHGDSVDYGVGANRSCPRLQRQCYPICLTAERWEEIVEFASDAGLKLAFGLNMRATNLSNIEALLRYTKEADLPVDTFELGNELGISYIEKLGPGIAKLVKQLWVDNPPLLVGPDDAGDGDSKSRAEFTKLAGEQNYLSAITFHAYPFHNGGGPTPSLVQHMMNTSMLDEGVQTYSQMIAAVKKGTATTNLSVPEVWMGEGNAAGHGGRPGLQPVLFAAVWPVAALYSRWL